MWVVDDKIWVVHEKMWVVHEKMWVVDEKMWVIDKKWYSDMLGVLFIWFEILYKVCYETRKMYNLNVGY